MAGEVLVLRNAVSVFGDVLSTSDDVGALPLVVAGAPAPVPAADEAEALAGVLAAGVPPKAPARVVEPSEAGEALSDDVLLPPPEVVVVPETDSTVADSTLVALPTPPAPTAEVPDAVSLPSAPSVGELLGPLTERVEVAFALAARGVCAPSALWEYVTGVLEVDLSVTVSFDSELDTDSTVGSSQEIAGTPSSWATTVGMVSRNATSSDGAGVGDVGTTVVGQIRSAKSVELGPRSSGSNTSSPQP